MVMDVDYAGPRRLMRCTGWDPLRLFFLSPKSVALGHVKPHPHQHAAPIKYHQAPHMLLILIIVPIISIRFSPIAAALLPYDTFEKQISSPPMHPRAAIAREQPESLHA
jgi:hypothetical protein